MHTSDGSDVALPIRIQPDALLADLRYTFTQIAQSKNLAFVCETKGNLPQLSSQVESTIRQVLERLLSNAFTFTERGHVTVAVCGEGDRLRVCVRDTGKGMSARTLATLLETERLAKKFPLDIKHHDRGLDDCRKLLASLGAALTLRSAPNVGTLAYFYVDTNAQNLFDPSGLRRRAI